MPSFCVINRVWRTSRPRAVRRRFFILSLCLMAWSASPVGAAVELFLPQVINGGGRLAGQATRLHTVIYALNLSDHAIEVEVELIQDDGDPFNAFLTTSFFSPELTNVRSQLLEPGQTGRFFTSSLGSIASGWGRVTASGAVAVQVNLSRQISIPGETSFRLASQASYPAAHLSSEFRTFQEFDFGLGDNDVGLALVNPSETETAEVRLALRDLGGALEAETTLTIPPRQKIARFLKSDLFAGNGLGVFGSVDVSSTVPISALPVSVDGDSWTVGPLLQPSAPIAP